MLVTNIFSFSHNLFYPSQNKFQFLAEFNLSSANAFNLEQSKNLSFGKDLMDNITESFPVALSPIKFL